MAPTRPAGRHELYLSTATQVTHLGKIHKGLPEELLVANLVPAARFWLLAQRPGRRPQGPLQRSQSEECVPMSHTISVYAARCCATNVPER